MEGITKFQFPSNGKAYPKGWGQRHWAYRGHTDVSIPCKRESLSKGGWSPQIVSVWCLGFQFPSNGKAYPKYANYARQKGYPLGFNSLQTGKPIQRIEQDADIVAFLCFNSLQTGKPIQRILFICIHKHRITRFNSLQTGKPIQSRLKKKWAAK